MENVPRNVGLDLLWYTFLVLEELLVFLRPEHWKFPFHVDKDKPFLPHVLALSRSVSLNSFSLKNSLCKLHCSSELRLQSYHLVRVRGLLGPSLADCLALSPPEANIRLILCIGFIQLDRASSKEEETA